MGCYWLKDHPTYSNFRNDCNSTQKRIPHLLISQALARTTITSSSELSEDPRVAKDNFDSLMRSRMIEAKFLIDRAKKIDDRVDVEREMGKLRMKNGELRIKN